MTTPQLVELLEQPPKIVRASRKREREVWGTPEQKRLSILQHMDAFDLLHQGKPNFYGMVRKLGKEYKGAHRPEGMRKGRNKMCFRNAALLALAHPEKYTYVEGIACSSIPMVHAWCVDKQGTVVDPTWKYPELSAYYGIEFSDQFLRREILANRVYGLLECTNTLKKLFKRAYKGELA